MKTQTVLTRPAKSWGLTATGSLREWHATVELADLLEITLQGLVLGSPGVFLVRCFACVLLQSRHLIRKLVQLHLPLLHPNRTVNKMVNQNTHTRCQLIFVPSNITRNTGRTPY